MQVIKEAVILKKRELIRKQNQKDDSIFYDPYLQLWINRVNGKPIVLEDEDKKTKENMCSQFGETTMSKTREGSDQEILCISPFGETALKENREGTDRYDQSLMSQFGETSLTESREGTDQGDVHCQG